MASVNIAGKGKQITDWIIMSSATGCQMLFHKRSSHNPAETQMTVGRAPLSQWLALHTAACAAHK